MFSSLLYVSQSLLDYPADADQLTDIQAVSIARNSELDITGALIATPEYFAQYLEGDRDALHLLIRSIRRDPRHTQMSVS
ncbi:MAG: BLUF domain-containing protein, partial [Sphingomonas sp.]